MVELASYKTTTEAITVSSTTAGAFNVLGSSHMHLHAGDKIVLYAQTTNTIEATISVRERYNPNR